MDITLRHHKYFTCNCCDSMARMARVTRDPGKPTHVARLACCGEPIGIPATAVGEGKRWEITDIKR